MRGFLFMAHEFKPGDLALVVASEQLPECVGSVVTLKQLYMVYKDNSGTYFSAPPGFPAQRAWEVEPNSFFPPGSGCVERHLMPLKGDEQPTQVRQAERVQ
jgi:hypothetical protein